MRWPQQRDAERPQLGLNRFKRKSVAKKILCISRDCTAGTNNSHHLGDAFCGIENKEDHQCRDRRIEAVAREGKRHGIALPEFRHMGRSPGTRISELHLRWVNYLNQRWCPARDEQPSEGTITAADIQLSHARIWCQPIQEYSAHKSAPAAHHSLLGSPVVQADLLFGHQYFPGIDVGVDK